MGKGSFKNKPCAYCGAPATTKDHIPPKSLLAKPYPDNLITVPSCATCNNGASKDDEYFRNTLLLRFETFHNGEVQKLLPTMHRALFNPAYPGFRKTIEKTLEGVELRTPTGLFVARTGSFKIEPDRLTRVVQRITKGLYYEERGQRLSDDSVVDVFAGESVAKDTTAAGEALRSLGGTVLQGPPKSFGEDAFTYWFYDPQEKESDDRLTSNDTVWMLRFYGAVDYLCVTGEPSDQVLQPGTSG